MFTELLERMGVKGVQARRASVCVRQCVRLTSVFASACRFRSELHPPFSHPASCSSLQMEELYSLDEDSLESLK